MRLVLSIKSTEGSTSVTYAWAPVDQVAMYSLDSGFSHQSSGVAVREDVDQPPSINKESESPFPAKLPDAVPLHPRKSKGALDDKDNVSTAPTLLNTECYRAMTASCSVSCV
jgi:hypothetical protein